MKLWKKDLVVSIFKFKYGIFDANRQSEDMTDFREANWNPCERERVALIVQFITIIDPNFKSRRSFLDL